MSTVLIAVIVIAVIVAISFLFIWISMRNSDKRKQKLLTRFSEAGTQFNLSFSSQEILEKRIIGLDGINRKLLVFENDNNHLHTFLISLDDIRNCYVRKIYEKPAMNIFKSKTSDDLPGKIVLVFEMLNSDQPVPVVFYDHSENDVDEYSELETKAKDWESVLNKMIFKGSRKEVYIYNAV